MKGLIGGRIVTKNETINFRNVAMFVGIDEGDEDDWVLALNCGAKKKDPHSYKAQILFTRKYAEALYQNIGEFLRGEHSFAEDEAEPEEG